MVYIHKLPQYCPLHIHHMQVYGSENLLRENDHIISVNDQLTSGMNNEEIRNALKQAKLLLVVKRYTCCAYAYV